jgi:hypothetical protein
MKKSTSVIVIIISVVVLLVSIACLAQSIYLETLNAKTQLATLNVYVDDVWALTLGQHMQCNICAMAGAIGGLLAILGLITGIEIRRVL